MMVRLKYLQWYKNLNKLPSLGTAPDAFFWVGHTARPSPEGYIIPYPEEYTGR